MSDFRTRVQIVWIDSTRDVPQVKQTRHEVELTQEEQFVQIKVDGKPITVISSTAEFAEHPKGGSMVPMINGRSMVVIAGQAPPRRRSHLRFAPMVHNSGRLTLIKPDQRSFSLV